MSLACGEWSLVRASDDGLKAIPLRCRRWDCPDCGPRQKRRLLRCLESTRVDALLTLTCARNHYPDPRTAFVYLSRQIPHLIKRLRRAYPLVSIEYFCVWEKTSAGWPHVHVLLRGPYIPQRLLARHWSQLARSPVVDIRAVRQDGDAARYLSKYLTKQPAVPPGYRRFRTSQSFWQGDRPTRPPRDPSAPAWSMRRDCLAYIVSTWTAAGLVVSFAHPSEAQARARGPDPPIYFPEVPYGQRAFPAAS